MASTSLLPVSKSISHPSSSENKKLSKITIKPTMLLIVSFVSLLFLACYANFFGAFLLGPKAPTIHLQSLSLSNLNVSTTKLAANWKAKFAISNPNLASKIRIDNMESMIYYKAQNAISIASSHGFNLGLLQDKHVSMEFATTGYEGDQPVVEYPVLMEIKKDQERGIMPFSISMNVWGTYKTSLFGWSMNFIVNSYCFDLNVMVVGGSGKGRLIGDEPRNCVVHMLFNQ
ncbi:hypothetical protein Tsubulata_037566 [Turnera subulata]|uniref:Late embryogenesis abundant protein LEA-2 subgroup domain-containing protein n=1 Tax=Turnera subulata TaxID=218843 RepID=A0A9Q0J7K0_9ROSI|nr:hypothetical protein Tsubulata_037566 [Turnera subulata]